MDQDYKRFKCIEKMGDEYKQRFEEIVSENAEILAIPIYENGSIYTEHDFDHHCCNLFRIISDLLLDDTAYSADGTGLNSRELYLLNIAVVLHDIGMFEKVDFDRKRHSLLSANKIEEKYRIPQDSLSEGKSGLSRNEIKALKRIVQAHSDVKDGSVSEEENGLKDRKLTNSMPGNQGKHIRARFLANVLRLADELDITNDRLGGADIEAELKKAVDNEEKLEIELHHASEKQKTALLERLARNKEAVKSYEHLKRLYFFGETKRDNSGIVELVIDDEYVDELLTQGVAIEKISDDIFQVYDKIFKEFEKFKYDIGKEIRLSNMIAIKDIKVSTQNIDLSKYLDRQNKNGNKEKTKSDKQLLKPHILSEGIADRLTKFVEKRNLLEVGHFKLHTNLCARDWIVADEVIETSPVFKKCEAQFLLHLAEKMKDRKEYLIVGIDFCGMLIASKLAYVMRKPYTYVIPDNISSSYRETEFVPAKYDKIVLVTDVIVTYDTIREIIKKYDILDKVEIIYAVFFRDAEKGKYIKKNQDLVKRTYVLNDYFNIELHTNEECRYKNCAECKAANIRYS